MRHAAATGVGGSRTAFVTTLAREHELLVRVASGDHTARPELNLTAMQRAVHADWLAGQLGLAPGRPLRSLASAVEEPWRTIFRQQLTAMRATSALASCDIPPGVSDFIS